MTSNLTYSATKTSGRNRSGRAAAHTADPSVPIRTRAEESDLTTDRLNWVLGATIGVKLAFPFGPPS